MKFPSDSDNNRIDIAMGKTNAAWHAKHRMSVGATLDQRVAWHIAHARHCGCRQMPASIQAEIKRRARAARRRNQDVS